MTTVKHEEYWPAILADPTKNGQIQTADAEWNTRAACVFEVLKNTLCARENQILTQQWENTLELSPADGATLNERKAVILYRLTEAPPLTIALLEKSLILLMGEGKAVVEHLPAENKLVVHTDRADETQLEAVTGLLARVLPKNIEVVKYNHDISIPWRDVPEGYTPVEYLEGTGSQYLQLDAVPWGYASRIKVEATYTGDGLYETLFCGSINKSKSYDFLLFLNSMSWRYGDGAWKGFGSVTKGEKTTFEKDRRKNYINGVLVGTNDEVANWEYDIRVTFFACRYIYSFETNPTYFMHGRLYSAVGWTHDIKQFDLLPCLDPTGAPCMYDKVSKTAFYNPGSGDFLYPGKETEASTYSLRRPVMYGQMTPHGVRRLYHAPYGYNGTREEYAAEHGFKPLVETDPPADGYWEPQWTETAEEIVLEWVETDPPAGESIC